MTWDTMTQGFWMLVGNVGRRMVEASDARLEWATPVDRLRVIIEQEKARASREDLRLRMDA